MRQMFHSTLGGSLASFEIVETEVVSSVQINFMYTVPMLMVTGLLNLIVIMMLWKDKKTIINKMMILDCTNSIVYCCMSTFQQSPFYMGLGWDVYCNAHLGILLTVMKANRLFPIAIVLFR